MSLRPSWDKEQDLIFKNKKKKIKQNHKQVKQPSAYEPAIPLLENYLKDKKRMCINVPGYFICNEFKVETTLRSITWRMNGHVVI